MTSCFMNNEFLPQMSCANVAVLGWGRHPGPAGDRAMTRGASKRVTPQDVSDRVPMDSVPCCYSALRSAGSSHSNYLVCDVLRYRPHHFDVVTKHYKCGVVVSFWCANNTHCDMQNYHPDDIKNNFITMIFYAIIWTWKCAHTTRSDLFFFHIGLDTFAVSKRRVNKCQRNHSLLPCHFAFVRN